DAGAGGAGAGADRGSGGWVGEDEDAGGIGAEGIAVGEEDDRLGHRILVGLEDRTSGTPERRGGPVSAASVRGLLAVWEGLSLPEMGQLAEVCPQGVDGKDLAGSGRVRAERIGRGAEERPSPVRGEKDSRCILPSKVGELE